MFVRPRRLLMRAALLLAGVLTLVPGLAPAQETAAPAAEMSLDDCIVLALSRQPALHAAQASLQGAMAAEAGLNSLPIYASLLSRDVPIRKQQACLGVGIQSAQLQQIEWETRYGVTRNYYSVIYAKMQRDLLTRVVADLDQARKDAEHLVKKGAGAIKLTQNDVDALAVNVELVRVKEAEATVGILKAAAALREAMGVAPDYPIKLRVPGETAADKTENLATLLPPIVADVSKEALISAALANRGELTMAAAASQMCDLEITAQGRLCFRNQAKTFAAGADIHAKPIPTGVYNGEYRPEAIGLEMPVFMIGKRPYRVDRARAYYDRSLAVVDKTQNLVALEVEINYLKWFESSQKIGNLEKALKLARPLARDVQKRFNDGAVGGEEYLRARGMVDQTQAALNEAIYNHALALAALERSTAGAYVVPRSAGK